MLGNPEPDVITAGAFQFGSIPLNVDQDYTPPEFNWFGGQWSWDLWSGFPANLAGIQILKEYMASEIGVADGELIALSKGLHLYDYSWELAQVTLRKK